jgi:PAS domain S-box-containing protein
MIFGILVPLLGLGIFLTRTGEEAVRVTVLQNHRQIARGAAGKIEAFLREPLSVLEITAEMMVSLGGSTWQRQAALVALSLERPIFKEISLVDIAGKEILISDPAQSLRDRSEDRAFIEGMKPKVYLSEMYLLKGRLPTMTISVPVKDVGTIQGVLIAQLDARGIWALVDGIKIGKTGNVSVFSRRGLWVAHPDKSEMVKEKAQQAKSIRKIMPKGLEIRESVAKQINGNICAVAPVPGSDWVVLTVQSKQEALGMARKMKGQHRLFLFLGFILSILIGWGIAYSVSRPIKTLSDATKRISQGESHELLPVGRQDEIGELTLSFNRMVGSLEQTLSRFKAARDFSDRIVENIPAGLLVLDKEMKVQRTNQALVMIIGAKRAEDLIGRAITELFGSQQELMTLIGKGVEGQLFRARERRVKTLDGREIEAVVTGAPFFGPGGEIESILLLVQDVTEQKKLEHELVQSEKRYKDLWETAPVAYHTLDTNGIITRVNQTEAKMLGYTPGKMIGKSIFEFILPEQQAEARKRFQLKLAGQQLPEAKDRVYLKKDGSKIFVSIDDVLERDSKGKVIGIRTTMVDITKRVQAEQELNRAKRHFQTLFNAMVDPVTIVDNKGVFMEVTDMVEEITGFKKEELLGRNFLQIGIVTPESKAIMAENLAKRTKRIDVVPYEVEVLTKNGRKLPYEVNAARITYMGKPADMVVFRDITERVRAEEELKKAHDQLEIRVKERTANLRIANKTLQREIVERKRAEEIAKSASRAKSDFLTNMSHELRTPLNAITGFSQMLQEQYFGKLNEEQAEYVTYILESGEHLLSLINDILDLSKIEAGKMALHLSRVNIKELLENSLIMIKEKCLKHGISLDLRISEDVEGLEITADERRVKQIMFNLLANAAKFTPDRGTIAVEAEQEGKEFIVSVSDTGIGIAPEHLEEIFEEFHQINGGLMGKIPGAGLGLALSKNFVEMHGGRIWAESEGKGKGSRFSFSLPLRDEKKGGSGK